MSELKEIKKAYFCTPSGNYGVVLRIEKLLDIPVEYQDVEA